MVKVARFSGDIPNLSKANSTVVHGRVIWLTKKNDDQKEGKAYVAYDHETKIKLGAAITKEDLVAHLERQDFSKLDELADKINGVS